MASSSSGTQPTTASPSTWVVILHFSAAELTRQCLSSLRTLDYPGVHVLLVDNGSLDRAGPRIASEFPEFQFLRLPDNLGFAGGCNAGARMAVEHGAEWIWFVNSDARVEPHTLSMLMAEAAADPKAGALGALIYTPHKGSYVPSGVGEIDFRRGKTLSRKTPKSGARTEDCEWLSGCNMLVRAEAFRAVEGFDERYFLYFEDTDLCFRLRQNGWHCLLVPAAKIYHEGGASTEDETRTTWRSYYYTRNRLLFFGSHLAGARQVPPLVAITAHLLRHVLVLPFRGASGRRRLKAEMLGLRDYLLKQFGKARCLDW